MKTNLLFSTKYMTVTLSDKIKLVNVYLITASNIFIRACKYQNDATVCHRNQMRDWWCQQLTNTTRS